MSDYPNAVERVYRDLRALIMRGELKPRERVTELQLADRFGVSRTPIREALSRLQSERLLRAEGRSLLVADIDLDDIREIYEMRIALESFGVARAAHRMTAADLDRLEGLVDEMERLVELREFRRLSATTAAFHWAILEPCGNRNLLVTCQSLIEACQRFRAVTMYFSMRQSELAGDHRVLLELLREGNPGAVEAEMRAHLRRASEYVR
jgi:DNA-binding GntR family transcriptional regulator